MKVLGAVLAGGRSRRFGSDKAMAPIAGEPMIAHVIASLGAQADAVVVVGRHHIGASAIEDFPAAGLGPLGGLAAALRHAASEGYDAVLSVPCDVPALPADLRRRLQPAGKGSTYAEAIPVIGWWAVDLADRLAAFVTGDPRRSVRGWASVARAMPIALPPLANVNTPADLAAFSA